MLAEESTPPSELAIIWRNLSISVRAQNGSFCKKNPVPYKRLINNVSGAISSGTLVVIMGPSGAGKSTLMGALAHRNSSDVFVEGDVWVKGSPVSRITHRISGFMHQESLFLKTLTVREHLMFTAKLKLGGCKDRTEINRLVSSIIIEMGLLNCINTRIGTEGEGKVISGGERKRLAFATEVLTDPAILFCDEPTTGLDSFSAQYLIGIMKQMTSRGKTILCTVHQPSSELFFMFQQLIFLADGRIAFMGDTESALKFFEKHCVSFPPNYNPAEIIIKVLSDKSMSQKNAKIKNFCDEFAVSETAKKINEMEKMKEVNPKDFLKDTELWKKSPSWIGQIYWLTYRSFLQVLRDPTIQRVRIIQKVGIAIMAGLCFFGSIDLTQAGVQSVQGVIFLIITENTFSPMYGVLPVFPEDFPLFLREYKNNLYSPLMYYFSKVISHVPGLILESVLFVVILYFISGLRRTFYAIFMSTVIAILTTNVACACGYFFSSAFGSVFMALAFLVPVDCILMVTSGLFLKLSTLPDFIAWFRYISWFMHSNEALSIVQWENVNNITCEYEDLEIPCLKNGEEVLEKFDFAVSHLSENIFAMGVMYCIFHVLAYVCLRWRINKNL